MDETPRDLFAAYQPGDAFVPDLPDPEDVTETQCECCPHVQALEKTIAMALHTITKQTEMLGTARGLMRKMRERIEQDAQVIEDLCGEKYLADQEVSRLQKKALDLLARIALDDAFLRALGAPCITEGTTERPVSE